MFIHYHMTPTPTTMHPNQTVAEAIELLARSSFRHLPLVDDEGVLAGVISDRDLRSAQPSSIARSVCICTAYVTISFCLSFIGHLRNISFLVFIFSR